MAVSSVVVSGGHSGVPQQVHDCSMHCQTSQTSHMEPISQPATPVALQAAQVQATYSAGFSPSSPSSPSSSCRCCACSCLSCCVPRATRQWVQHASSMSSDGLRGLLCSALCATWLAEGGGGGAVVRASVAWQSGYLLQLLRLCGMGVLVAVCLAQQGQ